MNRRRFFRRSLVAASSVTVTAALARKGGLGGLSLAASVSTPRSLEGQSFAFARLRYAVGNWDADPKMPANLLRSLAAQTPLRVSMDERIVSADSAALHEQRFLYLTGNKSFSFTESEREGLRRYLRGGGFLFVDDCEHDTSGPFAQSFEREIRAILDRPSEHLRRLPNDHALYRAFHQFPEGPPVTAHELNGWGDRQTHDYLQGVEIGSRLAVLYSNKDYGCEWNYEWENRRFLAQDNTRFGINIIAYALTQ